jgi:hypothetical protein
VCRFPWAFVAALVPAFFVQSGELGWQSRHCYSYQYYYYYYELLRIVSQSERAPTYPHALFAWGEGVESPERQNDLGQMCQAKKAIEAAIPYFRCLYTCLTSCASLSYFHYVFKAEAATIREKMK